MNTYGYVYGNPLIFSDIYGLDAESACKKGLYKACSQARKRCTFVSCKYPPTTVCVYPCAVAELECRKKADSICESKNEDNKPEPPDPKEPLKDENGCYWDYEKTWWGAQRLVHKCPDQSCTFSPALGGNGS